MSVQPGDQPYTLKTEVLPASLRKTDTYGLLPDSHQRRTPLHELIRAVKLTIGLESSNRDA
jgi:hypothetical protein